VLRWVALALGGVLFFAVAAAMLPMALGDRSLVIMSGSMEPTIPVGSLAMVEPIPSANLQRDDIIAYKPNETVQMPIVHRIVSVEMRQGVRYYVTRGDANTGADAELALPPTAWRVFFNVPFIGYIVSSTSSSVMSILLIGVPIFLIPLLSALEWLMKKRLTPLPVRIA
jgi:signal peptidase